MKFKFIDDCLSKKQLNIPKLNILEPDAALYKTLLFQPLGKVESGNHFVRSTDRECILKKFISFFQLSLTKKADLSVTPEYSCPWEVILYLIKNNMLPEEGKLWVIGCESIKPDELVKIIKENDQINWIYEEKLLEGEIENKFLDAVCYFFKTKSSFANLSPVIIVQFKTLQMGGDDFETDRLLLGTTSYILKSNDRDSILLTTVICSEGLEYEVENLPPNIYSPYLILHLQMNAVPFHTNFSNYRRNYYLKNTINKEFICLNWARNTVLRDLLLGKEILFRYGGSAFYTKSNKLNLADMKICNNHKNGLYYSCWKSAYAHAFYFNYDEFIFEFENTKVSQIKASPELQNNTGPRMIKAYEWTSQNEWKDTEVSDDLCHLCSELGIDHKVLTQNELTPINQERLILLSAGKIGSSDWFKPDEMESFQIDCKEKRNELNGRLTVLQDPDEFMKSRKYDIVKKFRILLNNIICNENNFPPSISDLINNCEIYYNPNYLASDPHRKEYGYHYNLYSTTKNNPASIAFVGDVSEIEAKKIFDNMRKLFLRYQPDEDIFEADQSSKRVVVWFENNREFKPIFTKRRPGIGENPNCSPESFRKGGTINEYS